MMVQGKTVLANVAVLHVHGAVPEEVPSLLLYYPIYSYAVDHQVQGVQLSPMLHSSDRFRNITAWYVETEEIVVSETDDLDKTSN